MCGNSAYSWNTVLTSRRRAGNEVTSTPPSLIVARGGLLEAGDHPQHRGLARSRGAEDREQLAVLDGQVGALDGDDHVAAFVEHLADADQLDLRIVNGGSDIRVRL